MLQRCCPLHPSCHHLQNEQVEVEGMNMMEVEDTKMVEEHDHLTKHRLGEDGMNMVEEYYYPTKHRLEVEDMDMMYIHMVELGVWIW
jgi:hypothetical protein